MRVILTNPIYEGELTYKNIEVVGSIVFNNGYLQDTGIIKKGINQNDLKIICMIADDEYFDFESKTWFSDMTVEA